MIQLRGVTKFYKMGDEEIHALDNVDLQIKEGDFIAIVGPSGSGKSTLANVIGGLDRPDSGEIVVGDIDLSKADDNFLSLYRNKKIGFVFQSFNLQPTLTALENVMLPLTFARVSLSKRKEKAAECLKAVGLEDRMNHRPNQLSGGQRQRVCIARALCNDPEIIVADEPTGNLDSKRGGEIVDLLKKLNKEANITLIVITHDPSVAHEADRVIKIQDGKLA